MLAKLLLLQPLFKMMNNEALDLLVEFGNQALQSGDPNKYLIEKLRKAVQEPSGPTVRKVEVVDVKLPPKK